MRCHKICLCSLSTYLQIEYCNLRVNRSMIFQRFRVKFTMFCCKVKYTNMIHQVQLLRDRFCASKTSCSELSDLLDVTTLGSISGNSFSQRATCWLPLFSRAIGLLCPGSGGNNNFKI